MKVVSPSWNYTHFGLLEAWVERLGEAIDAEDTLAVCRQIAQVQQALVQIAADVVDDAANRTTLTQKSVAEALDVPASTLRGWRS